MTTPLSAMTAFLQCRTVSELGDLHYRIGPPDDDVRAMAQHTVDLWDDEQAVSNILMYRDRRAPAVRLPTLIRGLEDLGYVQLAAAAGSTRVPVPLDEADRVALVDALLDLIAGQVGLAAQLAATGLAGLAHATDAAEIVVLLGHPDDDVRHPLQALVIELLGGGGLDALLDDPAQVRPEDAELAREGLADDGIDLADLRLPELSAAMTLPDRQDFTPDSED